MTFGSESVCREVEVAQLAAARLISGCVSSSKGDIALAEAGLTPMYLRGQGRAARSYEHYCRLPPENNARKVAEQRVPVVLKMPGAGWRTCWRNEALRITKEAGLEKQPREQLLRCRASPPWADTSGVSFRPALLDPVTRKDPPEVRR